ncbi:MAG TPA: sugar transferase [Candidatus Limnocylindria bacterium]|nr:sugar transferase [Candidatus Limnocylindria bacterium]
MVRRHTTALRALLMAIDFAAATLVFGVVSVTRYGSDWINEWARLGLDGRLAALAYGAAWVTLIWLGGMYRLRARWSLRADLVGLLRATGLLAVALITLLFIVHVSDASRVLIGLLLASTAAIAVVTRVVLRLILNAVRRRGYMTRFMLVVGANGAAQDFADRIERHAGLGLIAVGYLSADDVAPNLTRPVIGTLDEIERILHDHVVDEVAICLPVERWDMVEPVTRLCAGEGRAVRIPGDGRGPTVAGGRTEDFDGLTVTSLVYGPDRAVALFLKRAVDALLAGLSLVVLSPLFLVLALYIRRRDGSPVLFRQTRVGLNGRRFTLYKFRTMQPDAEQRLGEVEHLNEVRGRAFKLTNDPRRTTSGPFLRRSGLDELPQLWNVLRGDMSLVGPRPPLPSEVQGYDVWHRRRLSMKPGITGLWQVSARREAEFDRWVAIDLEYIDRWSLWLDLKIMARSVPAIIAQQGR